MERSRFFITGKKKYKATMTCAPLPGNRGLRAAMREEKKLLNELLVQLKNRSQDTLRGYLSNDVSRGDRETLVSQPHKQRPSNRTYYRIDNQMRYDLTKPHVSTGPGPKVNLQYQVGTESVAGVLIFMKPYLCPEQFQDCLLDVPPYGFSAGEVMEFVQSAFRRSAETKQFFAVGWKIEEVEEEDSRWNWSWRSRSRSRSLGRSQKVELSSAEQEKKGIEMEEAVQKEELKTVTKSAAVFSTKQLIKEGGKYAATKGATVGIKVIMKNGTKATAKVIPVVGFGVGLAFATWRCCKGDFSGAAMEVLSGTASCVPGVGTAASFAMDLAIAARDLNQR